jgi:hypothetical protein
MHLPVHAMHQRVIQHIQAVAVIRRHFGEGDFFHREIGAGCRDEGKQGEAGAQ